jgi:hypothetical protein
MFKGHFVETKEKKQELGTLIPNFDTTVSTNVPPSLANCAELIPDFIVPELPEGMKDCAENIPDIFDTDIDCIVAGINEAIEEASK